ncbi:hypothetical protein [Methylocapsa acidiphila]|uniref:hypothetical protein n=1 Tax=Methylocapsa acidiphila TaxID=133552 RepID=UPI000420A19F|nr:hypothetical protein [Methylocapsa acidiphila]
MTTKKQANEPQTSTDFDDLRREIRRDGARAAYTALLAVAKDTKAPAPARATAGVAILRASGIFDKANELDDAKPFSQMTPSELDRAVKKAERVLKQAERDLARGEAGASAAGLPPCFD